MPNTILLFMAAGLALNLTPGPDMLYVASRSAAEGRASGIVSALGISAGTIFHITAVVLGLSAVLQTVPAAYAVVRLLGGGYLVYLGIRMWRGASRIETTVVEPAPLWRVFRQGVITNVLNPKVALFFLAFLPQFVNPAAGSVRAQLLFLGLLFITSGTIVNVLVALGADRIGGLLRGNGRGSRTLKQVSGTIFIGLGLRIALAKRPV